MKPISKILAILSPWLVAIAGSIGVAILLMVLSGVFQPKTSEATAVQHRTIPENATVAEVQVIRRPRFESAVGTIKPIHESAVAAKILARVTEVNFTAGKPVTAGEVLVRLSDEDLQSRLKQAEAQWSSASASAQQAQSDLQRAQQLHSRNAISEAEFETALTATKTRNAELERAQRAVEESKVFLGYATIVAPFTGIVVDKQIEPGDTVSPGQPLLTIYDPAEMQLVANVRESLAMQLKVGQSIPAMLESMDHQCMATVREVVPQADVGSRSFQIKVSGPCPPGIYSGMFGRILLPLEEESLVVVPQQAVHRVGQLTLVDVVDGSNVVRCNVQIGREIDGTFEVLSGLKAGERVLIGQ
jgi:RND family efflux transporter MFP subunit